MSALRIFTVLTAMAALAFAAMQTRSFAGESGAEAPDCGACHQGQRSFSGRDSEQLAVRIRAILEGKVRHPPLELDDTSDEAIAELASQLTAAE